MPSSAFVSIVSGEFTIIAAARTESTAMLRSTVEDIQNLPGVDHVATSLYTERLQDRHSSGRATLDFDGSVTSFGRFAEGTAVGLNNK